MLPPRPLNSSPCAAPEANSERVRAYEIAAYLSAASFPFDLEEGPPPYPAPSRDLTLNALVQHGVHKLDCDRAFLSLIDNRQQFICAEMTKHQSLAGPDPNEPLLLGTARIALEWGVCPYTMAVFSGSTNVALSDSPYIIADKGFFYIKDFRQIPTFAARPYVTGYPNMVSYIEVPLKSLSGHILGSYCVVDTKSRDFLAPANLNALREVTLAINGYLDSRRLEAGRTRSEKMMDELCKFIDSGNIMPAPGYGASEPGGPHISPFDIGLSSQALETRPNNSISGSAECEELSPQDENTQSQPESQDVKSSSADCEQKDRPDSPSDMSARIEHLLSRATATIGHGMSLDGLVFFDAVVTGAQGDGSSSSLFTSNQSLGPTSRDESQVSALAEFGVVDGAKEVLECFPSQSTLQRLSAKYPRGHVFAMDEYGILDYESSANMDGANHPIHESTNRSDWAELSDCLPKARHAIFLPLWHYKRESCFATCLAWVSDKAKALDFGDVKSLTAFGNSLMVEILRVEARANAQIKFDFISSISHELRSPLHGIMTTIELMQDQVDDSHLLSMIDMIESCSSALLDTFDHLLEFSKINSRTRDPNPSSVNQTKRDPVHGYLKSEVVDLSSLVEDIIEVVSLGHSAATQMEAGLKEEEQNASASASEPLRPLLVTTNIERTHDWVMTLDMGAWKRILMNIFSNALKYTKTGHIEVTLKVQEPLDGGDSSINLSVTDTGTGISPEFLKYHLFTPFKQENSLSPGTGLGLSMVKSIVESLKGQIAVDSSLHKGTRVSVNIPLDKRPDKAVEPTLKHDNMLRDLSGHTFGVVSVTSESGSARKVAGSILPPPEVLQRCVRNICENNLKMIFADVFEEGASKVDVVLLDTHRLGLSDELDLESPFLRHSSDHSPPLIVVLGAHSRVLAQVSNYTKATSITSPIIAKKLVGGIRTIMAMSNSRNAVIPSQNVSTGEAGPQSQVEQIHPKDSPRHEMHTTAPNSHVEHSTERVASNLTTHIPEDIPSRPRPLRRPSSQDAAHLRRTVSRPGVPCRFKRFLLVDDNAINLRVLAAFAQRLASAYTTAVDGAEAVRLYRRAFEEDNDPYDCIFMDISMPVLDGFQAAAAIREFEDQQYRSKAASGNHVVAPRADIFALTSLGSEDARRSAKTSGIDIFLLKPLKFKDIVSLV